MIELELEDELEELLIHDSLWEPWRPRRDQATAQEGDRRMAICCTTKGEGGQEVLPNDLAKLQEEVQRLKAQLQERGEALRLLTEELMLTQQRERDRVTSYLHDHLQQYLVAVRMRVQTARQQVRDAVLAATLGQVEELSAQALQASRSLMTELRPPALQTEGLAAGLRWLAGWMEQHHQLQVTLTLDPAADPAHRLLRMVLFEGARELLFNAVKHAHVHQAQVMLSSTEGGVCLTVADGGCGFDPQVLGNDPSGYGLGNLRRRLEALGGRLEIESAAGQGARMHLHAPRTLERPALEGTPNPGPSVTNYPA